MSCPAISILYSSKSSLGNEEVCPFRISVPRVRLEASRVSDQRASLSYFFPRVPDGRANSPVACFPKSYARGDQLGEVGSGTVPEITESVPSMLD